jgi:hypothetical protein
LPPSKPWTISPIDRHPRSALSAKTLGRPPSIVLHMSNVPVTAKKVTRETMDAQGP